MTDTRWIAYPAGNPCPHRNVVPYYAPIDGAPKRPKLADVSLAMIKCSDCGEVLWGEAPESPPDPGITVDEAASRMPAHRWKQPIHCDHDEWVEDRRLCQVWRICTSCGQDLGDE